MGRFRPQGHAARCYREHGEIGPGGSERAGHGDAARDTQQVSLVLADAVDFSTFFAKQVSFWGQVVRENNIRA